ncbi:MAG: DUF481 domain-containing protein [Gemmatimonadota bacterium]|nr:DUF481 domain-containing protein [Gemmatimonadota bacterium]
MSRSRTGGFIRRPGTIFFGMPWTLSLPRAGALALAFPFVAALPGRAPAAPKNPAPAAPPKLWRASALANANVFFGNNQQQIIGVDGRLARVDSSLGLASELQTQYGEASVNDGPRSVTKRLWLATLTANVRPLAPVSSFVTTSFESNLEKRIASRYSLGAGARWAIHQTKSTDASLSLALSAERTNPMDSTVHFPDQRIARLSWLAKFHHAFDDRLDLSHSTSWQPSASDVSQFLVSSNTEFRYRMNGAVSLSMAFTDNYDSGAIERGARSYNDGQMLFGVAAGW